MSAIAIAAAALVRSMLTDAPSPSDRSVITGLRTPLGQSLIAAVHHNQITTPAQIDVRLNLAELERGDRDTDLAVVVAPTSLPGIGPEYPEAWNVTMTLPTLARILGQTITTEKE